MNGAGVDIWACGIIAAQLFITNGELRPAGVSNNQSYLNYVLRLVQEKPVTSVHHLISQMLIWNPQERIKIQGAVSHPCFDKLSVISDLSNVQVGEKRGR